MTEKVKVTREQAKAIEEFQKTVHELGISLDELKVIFESGYEVKPEFKKGDFVVWHGLVVNIQHPQTNDHKDDGSCYFTLVRSDGSTYGNITRDEIRHATPSEIAEEKERRWWKKHGRDAWELREGDILISKTVKYPEFVTRVNSLDVHFLGGNYETRATLKRDYEIVCFAENRLDVKTND